MITIKLIPNMLSKDGRKERTFDYSRDLTIREYLNESGFDHQDMRIVVSGKRIEDVERRIDNDDEILILPDIEFDPGTWAAIVAVFKAVATVATYASMGYSIYQAVTFKKPSMPNYNTNGDGLDESSPTYGWDGVQTIQEVGVPVPIIYGEHIAGGNIINSFVSTDGDKNYLNVLLALCEGEIEGINDLKINDNPSANFDGIETYERLGLNSDTVIPNFGDLHNLVAQSQLLTKDNSYVYTTTNLDVEAFELHLTLLNGLYQQNESTGALETWSVTYRVEYKLHTAGTYIDLGETTISAKSRTAVRRIFRKDALDADQYDIRITRTSDDTSTYKMGDLTLTNVDEIQTDDLAYPNTAKLGIKALATEQLSGSMPNFNCIIKGKKVSVPQIRYDGSDVDWDNYYWDPATSEYKRFSDDAVCSWDGSTYVEKWSANPIWCFKDLLLNSRYGIGEFLEIENIDDGLFLEMSRYCDERIEDGESGYEKRFRMDIVIDSPSRVPDLLMQLAGVFRGLIFFSEGAVKTRIDKPEVPVQLFGMGNIIEGGFSQQWKSLRDIPNVIEVQFLDRDKDYKQEKIAVVDEDALANGEPMRTKLIRVFTTKTSYALREGRYALKVAKYIDRSVTLKCGIDSIAAQAGDVISVSHDVPQWGFSGRVMGSGVGTVTLDREVVVEVGKTYKVQVRFSDDTIQERTVSNTAGTYTTLTVSTVFSQDPQAYDVYVFGESDKVVKPFRIVGMSINNSDEVEITAIEYDENTYDDSSILLPENNYSALSTEIPTVQDLDTTERAVTLPDGTIENVIDVYFDYPDDASNLNKYKGGKIYLSDNGGNNYNLIGYTEGREYAISGNIQKDATYYVKVVTVTFNGIEDSLSHSPTDSVFIVGKDVEPDMVSNFQYSWSDVLALAWSPNTEPDLAGYEIRLNDMNFGVDDSDLVYRGLATNLTLSPEERTVGTYYLRAYNTSGQYSSYSVSLDPVNEIPSQPTNLGVDVFFNVARIWWDDVAGSDVYKYEIWKSQTGDWSGEEEQLESVSGRGAVIDGNQSRGGEVDSATATTLVSSSLLGLEDDSLNGDLIIITSGVNQGEEIQITDFNGTTGTITIGANWTVTPEAGDLFMIFDRFEIKVRGHDYYGVGEFSDPLTVTLEGIDENAIGDNVVTARKIYVACLSALTANVGCLTAGTIQGVTFQTGAAGARTIFDSDSFKTYDSNCVKTFEVCDGCVVAKSMKLVDPVCDCCYSYLSAGSWYFHDELGNSTPYVKRICSGTACTGDTVFLPGWCNQPNIMVGINKLNAFDQNYANQTQQWDVYSSAPAFYCNCATDYGYCFDVHARLSLAASSGSAVVHNVNFGVVRCTCANVCATCVRLRFQLWCNAACANYYYGCLVYRICYRAQGSGVWCQQEFTYVQPHASVGQMQSTNDEYRNLTFPGSCIWEIMPICQSFGWINSGIPSGSTTYHLCSRAINGCAVNRNQTWCCCCTGTCNNWTCSCGYSDNVTVAGSKPVNTYCSYVTYNLTDYSNCLYYCLNHYTRSCGCVRTCAQFLTNENTCLYGASGYKSATCCGVLVTCSGNANWGQSTTVGLNNTYSYNNFKICSCFRDSWKQCSIGFLRFHHYLSTQICASGTVYHCYCCTSGSAGSCAYCNFYSTQDTFGTQTILDPNGCLNWLAIAYS